MGYYLLYFNCGSHIFSFKCSSHAGYSSKYRKAKRGNDGEKYVKQILIICTDTYSSHLG